MKSENVLAIAFSLVKEYSVELARRMEERDISLEYFFEADGKELANALGISFDKCLGNIGRQEAVALAEKEWEKMKRHKIKVLSIFDEDYPASLYNIPDPPLALYIIGDYDFNIGKRIAVVGTRKPTPYGVDFTEKMIADLAVYFPDLCIVSGLAYGVDACAHNAALKAQLPTVGVLAHGLNMIYPALHRDFARRILNHGGALVSEYLFGVKPFKGHFLQRNRIVAGLTDATIVIESDIKGGAMSTANYAFSYSREVMALPGRISDETSRGCNHLIRKEKAHLISCAADIMEIMDWKPLNLPIQPQQRNLFPELAGEQKVIYDLLRFNDEPLTPDRLHQLSLIPVATLMSQLSELEFMGIIIRHPGNRYSIA